MAGKSSRGVAIAIAVAVAAAVVVAVAAIYLGGSTGTAPARPSGPSNLGPETVQTAPGDVSTASFDSQSAALNGVQAASDGPPGGAGALDPTRFESDYLVFTTSLPPGPADDPVLAFLRRDAERYLARIRVNAEADHLRLKREGVASQPWEVSIAWTETARAGDIVSLSGVASEFTGGAHPIQLFDTHIANAKTGAPIKFEDMLLANRSPSPALQIAICETLKAAKVANGAGATIYDEPIVCAGPTANAKTDEAMLALAPSSVADHFGGLYAFYGPYVVGPYSEGGYRLTIQQAVFAEDMRPEYRKLFAGEAPVLEN